MNLRTRIISVLSVREKLSEEMEKKYRYLVLVPHCVWMTEC